VHCICRFFFSTQQITYSHFRTTYDTSCSGGCASSLAINSIFKSVIPEFCTYRTCRSDRLPSWKSKQVYYFNSRSSASSILLPPLLKTLFRMTAFQLHETMVTIDRQTLLRDSMLKFIMMPTLTKRRHSFCG